MTQLVRVKYVFDTKTWLKMPSFHEVVKASDPKTPAATEAATESFNRRWNDANNAVKPVYYRLGELPVVPGRGHTIKVSDIVFCVSDVALTDGDDVVVCDVHPYGSLDLSEWSDQVSRLHAAGWFEVA